MDLDIMASLQNLYLAIMFTPGRVEVMIRIYL